MRIDLRAQLKHLYSPSPRAVQLLEVPKFQFAMVDGVTTPGESPSESAAFQDAIGALYGISYTLKFTAKLRKENPIDWPIMALEALWWGEDGAFESGSSRFWNWTLMILQPDVVTTEMFEQARATLRAKKDNPALERVRLESFEEGLCVQIMHVGPYSEEPSSIEKLRAFARDNGYALRGEHHEIYLGDPRRSKPENLRTILRQPVERPG